MSLEFSAQITVIQKWRHTSAMVSLIINIYFMCIEELDPREYCISTKDFVLTEEGNLKGLNTGE